MGDKLARRFPKVRAVVWFHANKETDWRVNSSAASLSAFRSILAERTRRSAAKPSAAGGTP
jgi:hypothetical protein